SEPLPEPAPAHRLGRGSDGAGVHAPGLEVEPRDGPAARAGRAGSRVDHPRQHVQGAAPREVHQPEVVRLTALLLALVVLAPVVCAGWSALLAGAFLVEFLTHGRPAALSALTDSPHRRPLAHPGGEADLYVHAGLVAGRPLVLVHGFAPDGRNDPRVRDAASLLARAGFDVAGATSPGSKPRPL